MEMKRDRCMICNPHHINTTRPPLDLDCLESMDIVN